MEQFGLRGSLSEKRVLALMSGSKDLSAPLDPIPSRLTWTSLLVVSDSVKWVPSVNGQNFKPPTQLLPSSSLQEKHPRLER